MNFKYDLSFFTSFCMQSSHDSPRCAVCRIVQDALTHTNKIKTRDTERKETLESTRPCPPVGLYNMMHARRGNNAAMRRNQDNLAAMSGRVQQSSLPTLTCTTSYYTHMITCHHSTLHSWQVLWHLSVW